MLRPHGMERQRYRCLARETFGSTDKSEESRIEKEGSEREEDSMRS